MTERLPRRSGGGGGSSAASGLPSTFASFTAPTTLSSGQWAEFDCTSGPITQPLPSNPAAGATITVQKIDASANTLTVTPAGGGTIVGDPTATTSTQWGGFIYEHRGSNVWRVVPLLSTGPAGPTGASATVNVGTTTTGASGSSAAVTNSGSSTAAVLNFTVPKGDKGDTGATGAPGNATMIGFTYYNPATYASINTTSSTMVAASATNLKVTFTAPSSGNVLFRMSARAWAASGTPSIYWGLIDNNGGAVVAECIVGNDIATIRRSATLYVTGLTSGQSYTYNWGYHTTSAIQHWIDFGGAIGSSPAGPAVMEAWQVN